MDNTFQSLTTSSTPMIDSVSNCGISLTRIHNRDKIQIFEDLVKCSICFELLNIPYECETCGSLFCEACINSWINVNHNTCPLKCKEAKITKANIHVKKLLNLIVLRCTNFPECKHTSSYSSMLEHELKCPFIKIKCPNDPCEYKGSSKKLMVHLIKNCPFQLYKCGFCKAKIYKTLFSEHLDEHYKQKLCYVFQCLYCGSTENVKRCLCKQFFCSVCLEGGTNIKCGNNCYIFHNNCRSTTDLYNISKHPLPKNFEAKLSFISAHRVRVGITFTKDVVLNQTDVNCPQYDVYCILEDLSHFYSKETEWIECFPQTNRSLKGGDVMTVRVKNGELKYAVNGVDLGTGIKIDLAKKKDMYLYVQARNEKTRVDIMYITELFN